MSKARTESEIPSVTMKQARELALAFYHAGIPLYTHGAPGVGKSDLWASIARELDIGFIDLRLGMLESVDLRGVPDVKDGRAVWARPDFWPIPERDGEKGIILFDELADAGKSLQSPANQLILNGRAGEHVLGAGWYRCAAGNRREDRAAAQALSTALANRFGHITIEPDAASWAEWASAHGIPAELIAFIKFRPELLHKMPSAGEIAFPSPRLWQRVGQFVASMQASGRGQFPLRLNAIGALVGLPAASELEAFLLLINEVPPIEEIIKNPKTARVPDTSKPGIQWAVMAALARYATPKNIASILTYAERKEFTRELSVMLMVDAVTRTPAVAETQTFTQWAVKNQDITIGSKAS